MKKLKVLLLAMAAFGIFNAKGQKVNSGAYNVMLKTMLSHDVDEVSVEDLDTMKDVVYIDSREQEEYNVSHIKNAVWVGYEDFDIKRMKGVDKSSNIVVYCSVGKRSEEVTEKLLAAGYKDVANLYGGIFEWVNSGKPVYNKNGKTNKVHAYSKMWGVWLKEGEKVYSDK